MKRLKPEKWEFVKMSAPPTLSFCLYETRNAVAAYGIRYPRIGGAYIYQFEGGVFF